jgi:signal transduction histidine kinase
VLAHRAGRLIRVTVADEGPGIPLQDRERMFDRFWSGADRRGQSGLGLAIGRAIARRHGGDLRLGESRPCREPHDFLMGCCSSCRDEQPSSFRSRRGGLRGQPEDTPWRSARELVASDPAGVPVRTLTAAITDIAVACNTRQGRERQH